MRLEITRDDKKAAKWGSCQVNRSNHLQRSGSEEYAGTGNGLSLEPHEHIGPQGVIHVVPIKTKNTQTKR